MVVSFAIACEGNYQLRRPVRGAMKVCVSLLLFTRVGSNKAHFE